MWVEGFPWPSIDAARIACIFIEEIFTGHGALCTLLLARGRNFLSSLVKKFVGWSTTPNLTQQPITPHVMVKLSISITLLLRPFLCLWTLSRTTGICIPSILLAYRVSPCVSTGDSPFYLLYGRELWLPPDQPTALYASVEEHCKRIVTHIETAPVWQEGWWCTICHRSACWCTLLMWVYSPIFNKLLEKLVFNRLSN